MNRLISPEKRYEIIPLRYKINTMVGKDTVHEMLQLKSILSLERIGVDDKYTILTSIQFLYGYEGETP